MSEIIRIAIALAASGLTLFVFWQARSVNFTLLQYAVVGLMVITAMIHLLASSSEAILVLNGMGFMALLLALYFLPLPDWISPWVKWIVIGYTLLTIGLYFLEHPWGMMNGMLDRLGLFTKAVEVILLGLLLADQGPFSDFSTVKANS